MSTSALIHRWPDCRRPHVTPAAPAGQCRGAGGELVPQWPQSQWGEVCRGVRGHRRLGSVRVPAPPIPLFAPCPFCRHQYFRLSLVSPPLTLSIVYVFGSALIL